MTVYIMSKGRPHCLTASTLVKIGFPGEWFIVCGDNDEALLEYVERWGENRVMVFDWKKHAEGCDLMDCGPLAPSGAAPARNAIGEIAARRGEVRHWQFDDDYEGFTVFNGERFVKASGGELEKLLGAYEEFGLGTGAYAVGFAVATGFLRPDGVGNVRRNVTNCFNFRTRPWVPWTSRVFDDVTTPLRAHRAGEIEFCVPLAGALRKDSKKQTGGLCDLYDSVGQYERMMRAVVCSPTGAMVRDEGSALRIIKKWNDETVKVLHERWSR